MSILLPKVLILGCNDNQVPYINAAKELGFYVVGADGNHSAPGASLCDAFYNVKYDDVGSLVELGHAEGFTANDHVFTAAAQFAYVGAAHFAKVFGISFATPESIAICLDKREFYPFFQKLSVPIPKTWYVYNEVEFQKDVLPTLSDSQCYYMKSDFSKNPNYIYRGNKTNLAETAVFWGKDRYLRTCYILQEEFVGEHIRINLFGDRFTVYPCDLNQTTVHVPLEVLIKIGLIERLQNVCQALGIQNWLVKFDVIVTDQNEYVVLDIGLDPPYRMRRDYMLHHQNFERNYISYYLLSDKKKKDACLNAQAVNSL